MIRALTLAVLATLSFAACFSFNEIDLDPFDRRDQPLQMFHIAGDPESPNLMAVVDIHGLIVAIEREGFLGMRGIRNTAAHVRAVLERIDGNPNVKSVLVRINSPGGTVTASDLIWHEIRRYKQNNPGVRVYTLMMDAATSGGYYVASATDEIWAHPTTVTGSVGVIIPAINLSGLFEKIGVSDTTVKSGRLKDALSPLNPVSEKEREVVQDVVDTMFQRFLDRVKSGRPNMSEAQLATVSDGRIVDAQAALELGLVDRVGYFDELFEQAKTETRSATMQVVIFRERADPNDNLYVTKVQDGRSPLACPGVAELLGRPGVPGGSFLYVWPAGLVTAGQ